METTIAKRILPRARELARTASWLAPLADGGVDRPKLALGEGRMR
ncbi:MAG TPA: hypothetical protein VLA87_13465 [Gaiellaceae bacterium]|nr:hypothetical protein [Gaiellaceae bacterium]